MMFLLRVFCGFWRCSTQLRSILAYLCEPHLAVPPTVLRFCLSQGSQVKCKLHL